MISIVIATKDRPYHLHHCLKSIEQSILKRDEIIIVDQSIKFSVKDIISSIRNNQKIKYIHTKLINKSLALNLGIRYAKNDILAFIDDDCIVDIKWLKEIKESFIKYPLITGVTGKVLPYLSTKLKGTYCSAYFNKRQSKFITEPKYHSQHIGMGNNLACRKYVVDIIGGFKPWLGPGTNAHSGEDVEFMLRLLSYHQIIYYNPNVLIYHDKWLLYSDHWKQQQYYLIGEIACYNYFSLKGYKFAEKILLTRFKSLFINCIKAIKMTMKFNKLGLFEMHKIVHELICIIYGLALGFYHHRD